MDLHSQIIVIARIVLALLMGAIVGIEREISHKSAGLRTHMLVAGAAALLTCLGSLLIISYNEALPEGMVRADPTRVIQSIILGVGFIGAGIIIQREKEERVRNLTTAGSILFTAGIGIAAGLGQVYITVAATIMLLLINSLLGKLERRYKTKMKQH